MSRALCLGLVCALSARATGSPRTDPTQGRAVFTGAASGNATAIDLNPAAIGLGPTRAEQLEQIPDEIYIAALGTLDQYSLDLRSIDVNTGALGPGPRIRDVVVSPGATVAGIWHTGGDGRITIAAQAHTSPAERFLEYESLRYHVAGGYHRTVSPLTIAGSVRVTRRFYFGVSVAAQSGFLKLRYARDTALDAGRDPARGIDSDCGGAPCGVGNDLAAERYEVEASSGLLTSEILAVNLGVVVRIAKDTWIGLGYHTPPGLAIQNELDGDVTIRRAPRDGGAFIHGGASVYVSQPASFDLALRARLPGLLDLHLGLRGEDLVRFQSYDVRTYGSTLPRNDIPEWQPRPRGFQRNLALWGGVEQVEHDSPWIFGGRIGFETAALPDERTSPLTIAPASLTLDGGAQLRISPRLVLQATYGLTYFPKVDVTSSAFDPRDRLTCYDSGYDYTNPSCAAVRNGYAVASAAGEYNRLQHALRLAIRYELN